MDHQKEIETLSNQLTEFDSSTEDALCEQIHENKGHAYSQPLVFDTSRNPLVREACDAIMALPGDAEGFVASTRAIAHHLYTIIKGNHNITVGQLLFALFREDSGEPWLAIMKMQPAGDTYILEPLPASAPGDVRFAIQLRGGAILGGLLQKCAFVAPPSLRTEISDLIVRDYQTLTQGIDQPAARFFIDRFLGCRIKVSDREMTRHFSGVLKRAARDHAREWGTPVANAVVETIDMLQHGTRLDVVRTVNDLIPEQDRASVFGALSEKRVTAPIITVELAASQVQQQEPEYVWLEGDSGLLVRIEKDAYEAGNILVPAEPERGQKRFLIRTTDLVPIAPPFTSQRSGSSLMTGS